MLVKVISEAATTKPLRITSPQSGLVIAGVADLTEEAGGRWRKTGNQSTPSFFSDSPIRRRHQRLGKPADLKPGIVPNGAENGISRLTLGKIRPAPS